MPGLKYEIDGQGRKMALKNKKPKAKKPKAKKAKK